MNMGFLIAKTLVKKIGEGICDELLNDSHRSLFTSSFSRSNIGQAKWTFYEHQVPLVLDIPVDPTGAIIAGLFSIGK